MYIHAKFQREGHLFLIFFCVSVSTDVYTGGKVWQECGTACPPTCDTYRYGAVFPCTEQCVSGYFCPEGKVDHNGLCIDPSECPGVYIRTYIALPLCASVVCLQKMYQQTGFSLGLFGVVLCHLSFQRIPTVALPLCVSVVCLQQILCVCSNKQWLYFNTCIFLIWCCALALAVIF